MTEPKFAALLEQSELRLKTWLTEQLSGLETRLRDAIQTTDARQWQASMSLHAFDERLTILERRISGVERRSGGTKQ